MPFPIEDQRHVKTTLAPRTARKNPYGNGKPFWIVFDWPGPAKASQSNAMPLPFDFRVEIVQVSYTSGGGTVGVRIYGLGHPDLEGPHYGQAYVLAPDDADVIEQFTRVSAEILSDVESVDGVTVLVYGQTVS